jgi:hypothetical protein
MKTTILMAATAAVLVICPAAQAQKLVPGLWEHAMTMKSAGGQADEAMAKMQAQMAAMPPEKRKMVEEMMAQRGIQLGGAGKPTTAKVCLTAEQAARDQFPEDGRCTRDAMQRSGNTLRFKFTCQGTPPTSGEGEFTMTSEHAYTGHMVVDRGGDAKVSHMEMQLSGTWLGSDCGSFKPRP